jgi:hypothetical protein
MKNYLLLAALSFLFLVGCKDPNNVSNITPAVKNQNTQKSVTFLTLPASIEPRSLQKARLFLVTPQNGGNIKYSDSYLSAYGKISINLNLEFPPNSVTDSIIVSINLSQDALTGDLGINFGPSPAYFLTPALLTFTVKGLDPLTLPSNPANIQFVYLDNGIYFPMQASRITVDVKHGSLSIVNGQVPHFSRYGWSTIDGSGE